MAFMDLISIRASAWTFTQADTRHFRDKCLLSLLTGRIVHFPHSLIGECAVIIGKPSLLGEKSLMPCLL